LVENLKTKLNNIIEEKEWEFNNVVEHDYTKPEIIDCLIYYLTSHILFILTILIDSQNKKF
jgi:hypothetical protein